MCTRNDKHIIHALIAFFSSLFMVSCDDAKLLPDCNNCISYLPEYYNITISFSINDENSSVNYTIYSGDFETGQPILYDNSTTSTRTINLPTGNYYTVVAEYASKGRCIMVVDGNELKYKANNSDCTEECYMVEGYDFDVRLKY